MTAAFVPRLFHDGPIEAGRALPLDADASHHALRVLRLSIGDSVVVFNGDGRRWLARILAADRRGATVDPEMPHRAGTESALPIVLAQGLPSGDKMDWVIEKATELGVASIRPLMSARSVARLDAARAERRLVHWRRVAIAACMQCGRDRLPEIAAPRSLADWLREGAPGCPDGARLLLSPRDAPGLAMLAVTPPPAVTILAGPEGGFTDEETAATRDAGWRPLRLGPRTLRSETAGIAAIAALQAVLGDFRGP
jgi:16S rRNA (uracil1498-N3)-methyltransferase